MSANYNYNITPSLVKLVVKVVGVIVAFFVVMAFVRPWYNVWSQEMEGKAEFAKAEQNRKIKIEEARANLEAEKLNAQAEIERAKGAAEAIKIENGIFIYKNYIPEKIKIGKKEKLNLSIEYDCRLKIENGKWFLCIPIKVKASNEKNREIKKDFCCPCEPNFLSEFPFISKSRSSL